MGNESYYQLNEVAHAFRELGKTRSMLSILRSASRLRILRKTIYEGRTLIVVPVGSLYRLKSDLAVMTPTERIEDLLTTYELNL